MTAASTSKPIPPQDIEAAVRYLLGQTGGRPDRMMAPASAMISVGAHNLAHACGPEAVAEFLYQYADNYTDAVAAPPGVEALIKGRKAQSTSGIGNDPSTDNQETDNQKGDDVALDWMSRGFVVVGQFLARPGVRMAMLAVRIILMSWGVCYFLESLRGLT